MKGNSKKGFTIIELIIALAVFVVITTMVFSGLSSFFRMKTIYAQEMTLQQNFRFAVDKITQELRQASKDPASSDPIIFEPDDLIPSGNAMGEKLVFSVYLGTSTKYIVYKMDPSPSGTNVLVREEHSAYPITSLNLEVKQPVTEEIKQLVKLYFVRSGGKVVIILVGKTNYLGKENIISFTSLAYSRNSSNEYYPP